MVARGTWCAPLRGACAGVVLLAWLAGAMTVPQIENDQVLYGREENGLLAFGQNRRGQLGLAHRVPFEHVLSPRLSGLLGELEHVVHLATGCDAAHTLAVTSRGTLLGWGSNDNGELGLSPFSPSVGPTVLGKELGLGHVGQAVVSRSHSLILTRKNDLFRLKGGRFESIPHPHLRFISVAAGNGFSLLASEDGRGFYLDNQGSTLVPITDISGFIVRVSACATQAFLVTADGVVWTWGDNSEGQLCVGTSLSRVTRTTPASFRASEGLGQIVEVHGSPKVTLALTDDGAVLSCSSRSEGLQRIKGIAESQKVLSLSVGNKHAVVTFASGQVFGWGSNEFGQLGSYNSAPSFPEPTELLFTGYADRKYAAGVAGQDFTVLLAECANSSCVHGVASAADGCSCVCEKNWAGDTCAVCDHPSDFCGEHGRLRKQDCGCECTSPWEGQTCAKCSLQCAHGVVNTTNGGCKCSCHGSWGGSRCDVCQARSADCVQGTLDPSTCKCKCSELWKGDHCDVCALTKASCVNGELDKERCECKCRGDWTGAQCNECGIGSKQEKVCVTASLWNEDGGGWRGHSLYFVKGHDELPVAHTTLEDGYSGEKKVCLEPGMYDVYACGPSQANTYSIGWSVLGTHGQSSGECGKHTQPLLIKDGQCNMGSLYQDTCACKCEGGWTGQPECITMEVSLHEAHEGSWVGNRLIFENEDGQYAQALGGMQGTRSVCLPEATYKVYSCGRGPARLMGVSGVVLGWDIALNGRVESGSGSAFELCDAASQASAMEFNMTKALRPSVPASTDRAVASLGVDTLRPRPPQSQQTNGRCDFCPVVGKCKHGEFQHDCTCRCEGNWAGPACDTCLLDLSGFQQGRARLDAKHCRVHCVGGWKGDRCDECGLIDAHCEGVVDHTTCSCQPVEAHAPPHQQSSPGSQPEAEGQQDQPHNDHIPEQAPASSEPASVATSEPAEERSGEGEVRQCKDPWTGPDCSVCPRDQDFCQHNGTLEDCLCDCHVPWMGDDCSKCAIRSQSCNHGSKHPGLCQCDCEGGWSGIFCTDCKVECGPNGKRNESCECSCFREWTGPTCSECTLGPGDCGHGSPVAETCSCKCDEGWAGDKCDTCVFSGCFHGELNKDICGCVCDASWGGKRCDECTKTAEDCVHGSVNEQCACDCETNWASEACDVCSLGEHSCAHGIFEEEMCKCVCPEHRSGLFCETCDLTPNECGGSVNMEHCTCNPMNAGAPSTSPTPTPTVSWTRPSATPTTTPSPSASMQLNPNDYQGILNFGWMMLSSYDESQDTRVNPVVADYSVRVLGDAWKAFKLEEPFTITPNTHLEFDLKINFLCESVMLGMAPSNVHSQAHRKIALASTVRHNDPSVVDISDQVVPKVEGKEWQHYNVLLKHVYEPGDVMRYLTIMAPCDSGDLSNVEFRRVQLYEGASQRHRDDLRCGGVFVAPYGGPAECPLTSTGSSTSGVLPCCSIDGFCSASASACDCDGCIDFRPGMAPPAKFAFTLSAREIAGATQPVPFAPEPEAIVRPSPEPVVVPQSVPSVILHPDQLLQETDAVRSGVVVGTHSKVVLSGPATAQMRLEHAFRVTPATHLELDFAIGSQCVAHGISLSSSADAGAGGMSFLFAGSLVVQPDNATWVSLGEHFHSAYPASGGWRALTVPVGLYLRSQDVSFVSVFNLCDSDDANMAVANVRIHEAPSMVDFSRFLVPYTSLDSNGRATNMTRQLTLYGRAAKAVPLTLPHILTAQSRLEFDLKVPKMCQSVSVGLAETVSGADEPLLLRLAGLGQLRSRETNYGLTEPYLGGWKHYNIPVGLLYAKGETFPYLVFAAECEDGLASFANVELYTQSEALNLAQLNMHSYDDDHDLDPVVAVTGATLELSRGTWKAMQLPKPWAVTEGSHMEFDFQTDHLCERHAIALATSLESSEDNTNVFLAGHSVPSANDAHWVNFASHRTYTKGWLHFVVPVGEIYAAGKFPLLAVVHDCACGEEEQCGSSRFANVRLFELGE